MSPRATSASTTNAGIQQLSNGASVIPASTRPDGSVRKVIRVKPGYKPPEDVEVYRNRTAETWRNRGKGGVPGAESTHSDGKEVPNTSAANKNAKRREARKKAAAMVATEDQDVQEVEEDRLGTDSNAARPDSETAGTKQEDKDPEAENAKEARKLAKKLRQARELQEKKEKGDSLLPEQLAKVIKINELIRQLDSLGCDDEGEKLDQKGGDGGT